MQRQKQVDIRAVILRAPGTYMQANGFATDQLTAGMTLMNKGLKAGPGGRSSVSQIFQATQHDAAAASAML